MDWLNIDKYPSPKDGLYIACVCENDPDVEDEIVKALREDGVWYYAPIPHDTGDGTIVVLHRCPIEEYGILVTHYIPWPEHPSRGGYYSQGMNPSNES